MARLVVQPQQEGDETTHQLSSRGASAEYGVSSRVMRQFKKQWISTAVLRRGICEAPPRACWHMHVHVLEKARIRTPAFSVPETTSPPTRVLLLLGGIST